MMKKVVEAHQETLVSHAKGNQFKREVWVCTLECGHCMWRARKTKPVRLKCPKCLDTNEESA